MNKEEQAPMKQITPPYLSVLKLEEMVELISNRNYPVFSSEIFKNQGFNGSDAAWSVSALKFLGVLNDDGTPTPLMAQFRLLGEARKIEIEKIVRAAYKPLFDAVNEPQNLPSDNLVNEFVVQYRMSRGLAKNAARVFIKLSEFGGLKEPGAVTQKISRPHTPKKPGGIKQYVKQRILATEPLACGVHVQPIVKGKMDISIPEDLFLRSATDDDLNNAWRDVLKAAHRFAELYLKDDTADFQKAEII